jgi:hypothetical protein
MSCSAPDCGNTAICLNLCIEHFQRPGRKHRMTAKRKATIEALAEKYVAADDPPPGIWPGLHYPMGRGFRKRGIRDYLKRWVLAHGNLPDGVHDVLWNSGDACMQIDFTRLRNDPAYPMGIWHPDYRVSLKATRAKGKPPTE